MSYTNFYIGEGIRYQLYLSAGYRGKVFKNMNTRGILYPCHMIAKKVTH